jgi:microcystin-dependent protein
MEGTIGEIRMFAGNFAPRAWAFCNGQLLSIAQNTALFSILGTTYGGNGQTTFALPNFNGRTAVGTGTGPGLSNVDLGQVSGVENTTLTVGNLPAHNHTATATITGTVNPKALADAGLGDDPANSFPAISSGSNKMYTSSTQAPDATMGASPISATVQVTVGNTGSSQPVNIRNPYLGMNYIICLEGIFPSRN